MRGAPRQLTCWGVVRDYPPEATKQYEEFGQVTAAAALVDAGACSWEVVTAGKHHACGITAVSGVADVAGVKPGEVLCWGSDEHGQSSPPKSGSFTSPWRAWPATPELTGSVGLMTLVTTPAGRCAVTSGAGSGGRRGRGAVSRRAIIAATAAILLVAVATTADPRGPGADSSSFNYR